MDFQIERVNAGNYSLFDDMVFRRENGFEREPSKNTVSTEIKKELAAPYFYVYAAKADGCFVGWISLTYIPKVGRWNGHGHVFVDELWVQPDYRGQGLAKALMKKADELKTKLNATGIRLYVNINNPTAKGLYERCGYVQDGQAYFMEK